MRQMFCSGLLAVGLLLTLNGCYFSVQGGLRRPVDVTADTANGVTVTAPTVGQIAGDVLQSQVGAEIYWHKEGGDYERAPQSFDLEYERLSNGRYWSKIAMSIVPNGITGTLYVRPVGHAERIEGPTRRNGWMWRTPNYEDGAWRHYQLVLRYANSEEVVIFEYSVRSSPNRRVMGP